MLVYKGGRQQIFDNFDVTDSQIEVINEIFDCLESELKEKMLIYKVREADNGEISIDMRTQSTQSPVFITTYKRIVFIGIRGGITVKTKKEEVTGFPSQSLRNREIVKVDEKIKEKNI